MTQTLEINGKVAHVVHDLDSNAQITAAARFWQLCMAIETGAQPSLRKPPHEPTFLEDRRIVRLVGHAARRAIRLIFGVVLRDVSHRPEMFSQAVAALTNGMVQEIGEMLADFPFEERVRALEGLSAMLAQSMGIGLADAPEDGSVQ